ncbi:related to aspartic proteinase precursor [Fusarium fujikuroi]|nr:related to aspartic proteinase precursor [Fusarium fujikuroi]SCO11482.1 related to aspartic proteinase precursor [Fusarium fujikuroi]SCO23208.1 related to aspartic proteinase precursor [Fusarium fujikuroi]SCO50449.1 related to aspartic proteinase precursor [Fusarium fujikuroi]
MRSLAFLAVLLVVSVASASASASASAAASAATPQHKGRKGFSLEATKNSNSKPDFVREWVAAHQKWGKGVSPETLSAFSLLDDDGRVDVKPLGADEIYIADVKVGNPPQTLKMALDTGSADLWVQSTDTIYRANPEGPWAPRYKPNSSKTSRRLRDAEWEVEYVDGTHANGIVYLDTVRLGDFELNNTAIQSAQIVAPRFERETELTGILGLAKSLPSNIDPPTPSLLDKLRPLLADPVFTVDMRRNATGRFDFGYIDENRAKDNISWMATREDSPHWDVTFDTTAWTGLRQVWMAHTFEATIDTGTTLLFLPGDLASMYWYDVPDMRVDPRLGDSFTFPCKFSNDLPDLMFKVPGTEHVLRIPGPYLSYSTTDNDSDYCWGGLQSAESLGVTIIGDIALKALYVAFDLENNKVGFANKDLDDVDDW